MTSETKKSIKTAFATFGKSLIPLVTALIGTILGSLCGNDSAAGASIGSIIGAGIYSKIV